MGAQEFFSWIRGHIQTTTKLVTQESSCCIIVQQTVSHIIFFFHFESFVLFTWNRARNKRTGKLAGVYTNHFRKSSYFRTFTTGKSLISDGPVNLGRLTVARQVALEVNVR